ncbi:MAG: glycoside hydrolase family 3 N-terminal domain-containing protein [Caldilineaceae bacterium]
METPEASPTSTPETPLPTVEAALTNDVWVKAQVDTLLSRMGPADRVGQLFIVGFQGNDTTFDINGENNSLSDRVLQLIYAYRVGGFVLSPRNGNFSNAKSTDTPRQVATLVNRLQSVAYGIVLPEGQEFQPVPNEPWPPPNLTSMEQEVDRPPQNLPLFIAVEQMGDSLNATALRQGGFTELPSPLAVGSTWNPDLAEQVGEITGRELRAVGVNLLLGPNLDVVDAPRSDAVGSLGLFSFGGNPYWVSRMGRAYIAGIHSGSNGRVGTIARYFPGQGDVDRMPDEDVATIQKSRDELERTALAPFASVTAHAWTLNSNDPRQAATEGLMSSHMRFAGLQGEGSGHAVPLSLDLELPELMSMDRFKAWRDNGGVMMSGSLGAPAIQRFYDPSLKEFPASRIVQSAFDAGNDLLFLDRFALTDDWESQFNNIKTAISFFQDQYTKDPNFAARVDSSVRRILYLKLHLYLHPGQDIGTNTPANAPLIPLSNVLVPQDDLSLFGSDLQDQARITVSEVARESISLLYPDPQLQPDPLLLAPQPQDKVVIFTDSRLLRECESCMAETAVGPDEIAKTIDLFYGENSTGRLPASQVTSLTFTDLNELLDAAGNSQQISQTTTVSPSVALQQPSAALTDTVDAPEGNGNSNQVDKNAKNEMKIAEAHWLIFAMLDIDPDRYPNSNALRRFLRQRSEQLKDKKIVVLALGPPYFLDATEISKLTAYYGVYSRGREFIENTVRALFRSLAPSGAPAVDVPGTRFARLVDRLQPDPTRKIPIRLLRNEEIILQSNAENLDNNAFTAAIESDGNNSVTVEIGPILDQNQKIVVDGTEVILKLTTENGTALPETLSLMTSDGMAHRDIVLDHAGVLHISALAGSATSGDILNLTVRLNQGATANSQQGTVSNATNISTNIPVSESAPISTPLIDEKATAVSPERPINVVTLVLSLLTIGIVLSVLLLTQIRVLPRMTLVNSMCWATICGLGSYIVYGYGWIPGTQWLALTLRVLGAPIIVFISMLIPLLWLQLRELVQIRPPQAG